MTTQIGVPPTLLQSTPQGFRLYIDTRIYEVKAQSHQGTKLSVAVHASLADQPHRGELSTIDLYSHRSRQWFAELCAKRFDIDADQIHGELLVLLEKVEERALKREARAVKIELTNAEQLAATNLLKNKNLTDHILRDLEALGYVGEDTNKLLTYLVATSRKLEKPLSLLIESRSGAGKSALQDAILALMPHEEYLKYNRITDQALFYQAEDNLSGKLLVIEEATGMGGAAYSIRALQSGQSLKVAATGKDPLTGQMRTHEYEVKVRTAVMMTKTQTQFDEETKSRFLCTTINETQELTEAVLQRQRQQDTIEGIAHRKEAERIAHIHHNAQRLLLPILVANPYAPKLTFPATTLTARRDNKKYLQLIKAVCLLHQHQREKKKSDMASGSIEYIEATVEDIAIANRIAKEVLVHQGDVTPQGRLLFGLIRKMLVNGGGHRGEATFTRRQLREHCDWGDWQVRSHLEELVGLEYISVRQGRSGKQYAYALDDTRLLETLPGFGLTDPEALRVVLEQARPAQPAPRSRRNLEVKTHNLEAKTGNLEVVLPNLEAP